MNKRFVKMMISMMLFIALVGGMRNNVYASTLLKKGMLGIDVSKYQGSIDWERVKNSGHASFVIIRVGYGNDEESQDDQYAEYNMSECERLNIPYGVYLYNKLCIFCNFQMSIVSLVFNTYSNNSMFPKASNILGSVSSP